MGAYAGKGTSATISLRQKAFTNWESKPLQLYIIPKGGKDRGTQKPAELYNPRTLIVGVLRLAKYSLIALAQVYRINLLTILWVPACSFVLVCFINVLAISFLLVSHFNSCLVSEARTETGKEPLDSGLSHPTHKITTYRSGRSNACMSVVGRVLYGCTNLQF